MNQSLSKRVNLEWLKFWRHLGDSQNTALCVLRTMLLAAIKFHRDKSQLHASALTFYSLIALIPTLALMLGMASGFGLYDEWMALLLDKFAQYEEGMSLITEFSEKLLKDTNSRLITGVGFFLLLWSLLKAISHVEMAFNSIWRIEKQRSLAKKVNDYLPLVFIAPFLYLASNSVKLYFISMIQLYNATGESFFFQSEMLWVFVICLPAVTIITILSWLYYFLPNTYVSFQAAMLGGAISGVVFDRFQSLYIAFQFTAAKYDAVYGSFIAFPLLLFWIYISWFIILCGAEIAFIFQNRITQPWQLARDRISLRMSLSIMLEIYRLAIHRYVTQRMPLTAHAYATHLNLPMTYIIPLLASLQRAHLVYPVKIDGSHEHVYIPTGNMNLWRMQNAIRNIEEAHHISKISQQSSSFLSLTQLVQRYAPFLDDVKKDTDFRELHVE